MIRFCIREEELKDLVRPGGHKNHVFISPQICLSWS